MTPTPEVAAVAGKLTKAQREGLLRADPDGNLGKHFLRWWNADSRTLRALVKFGLGFTVWSGICLTPLGLAVRQHLVENTDDR